MAASRPCRPVGAGTRSPPGPARSRRRAPARFVGRQSELLAARPEPRGCDEAFGLQVARYTVPPPGRGPTPLGGRGPIPGRYSEPDSGIPLARSCGRSSAPATHCVCRLNLMNVSEWWSSVMVGSLLWRRNSCVSCALIPAPGISPGRCDDSKEHFSMSRIAKGLALTSIAAAAVAGTAGIAAADSGATGSAAQSWRPVGQRSAGAHPRSGQRLREHRERHRSAEPRVRQHLRQRLTSAPTFCRPPSPTGGRPVRVVPIEASGFKALARLLGRRQEEPPCSPRVGAPAALTRGARAGWRAGPRPWTSRRPQAVHCGLDVRVGCGNRLYRVSFVSGSR